jgi:hypothetical protein
MNKEAMKLIQKLLDEKKITVEQAMLLMEEASVPKITNVNPTAPVRTKFKGDLNKYTVTA